MTIYFVVASNHFLGQFVLVFAINYCLPKGYIKMRSDSTLSLIFFSGITKNITNLLFILRQRLKQCTEIKLKLYIQM